MHKRPVRPADLRLSQRLKAAGHDVEPRQIERWRIDGGVVEASTQPSAFLQASQVLRLLDDGLSLEQVALVQFRRGNYVTTAALKTALKKSIVTALGPATNSTNWMQARTAAQTDAEYRTRQLARQSETKPIRKQIHAAARQPKERVNQTFDRVLREMLMLVNYGEATSRSQLKDLLAAAGLPPDAIDLNAFAANAKLHSRKDLETALAEAERTDLEQAREDLNAITASLKQAGLTRFDAFEAEHGFTLSLLALLSLRKTLGSRKMDWVISVLNGNGEPAGPIESV